MNLTRRNLLAGIGALSVTSGLRTKENQNFLARALPRESTILFQGDSITDAGRNRGAYYANNGSGMGQGYVKHIVTDIMGRMPEKSYHFYNRGISGNKVYQLRDRWKEDCLQLRPDVLSILIGVNDFWHTLSNSYKGTSAIYKNDFKALLETTLEELPNVKLIIGEPFVMHEGTAIQAEEWKGHFEEYQNAAKEVADQFSAAFIPYQKIFTKALELAPTSYWCPDGVHPSMAGNFLMAKSWIEAFSKLD